MILRRSSPQISRATRLPSTSDDAWDWFAQLVLRAANHELSASVASPSRANQSAVHHALDDLGWASHSIRQALAAALRVDPHWVSHPPPHALDVAQLPALAILLPVMLRHGHDEVRTWARRWLELPDLAFQLPIPQLLDWLTHGKDIPAILHRELKNRALALVGPHGVLQLARHAVDARIRELCTMWCESFTVLSPHSHSPS